MSYQPNESALLRALQRRATSRENQYVSLMELGSHSFETAARNHGVPFEGRTPHEIACDIVDVMYPETHGDSSAVQSDVTSDPNKFDDTMFAQAATADDERRYGYVLGDLKDNNWPVDVPERQAGVGYRRQDGTVVPLDSEGSALLSGWGPEQVRFLLVSMAPFFEVDYIKQFVLDMFVAAHQGQYGEVYTTLQSLLRDQRWVEDAEQAVLSELPVQSEPVDGPPTWTATSQATEFPVVGTGNPGDAPTEVINTGEIGQYRPEGY